MSNHKLERVAAVRGKENLKHPVRFNGIRIDESDEHWKWTYVGTREAILAAGLARPEWLPGTAECAHAMQFSVIVAGRSFRVIKRNNAEYAVEIEKSAEERDVADRRQKLDAIVPGLNQDAIAPDVPTRLLACWGLLSRAAMDIGVRCEGSTKLQRALDDVLQVRDVLGTIAGELSDLRLEPPGERERRLRNDQELRTVVLQIQQQGRDGWDWWRSHTGSKWKSRPGTPSPIALGDRPESGHAKQDPDEGDADDDDWPST